MLSSARHRAWQVIPVGAVAPLCAVPGTAKAHSFGQMYSLPVPVWLYLYGATAALLLSFVVVGLMVNRRSVELNQRRIDLSDFTIARALVHPVALELGRALGVMALMATILSGLFGVEDAYANFAMTMFWIVFVLGYTYTTALVGNTFAILNPWLALCHWIEWMVPGAFAGRISWPRRGGYSLALLLYMAFIAYELFGRSRPHGLALVLCAYTVFNLVGAWLFGRVVWFRQVELFAVMFAILGRMSPLCVQEDDAGRWRLQLRQPFVGLCQSPAAHMSLLLVVLFMLSSTAYDGFKSTMPFVRLFWEDFASLLAPWIGSQMGQSFPILKAIYPWWQLGWLLLSPFVYLAIYWLFIALTKWVAASEYSVRELALRFAFSLVPIAFVYHLTHYFSLLLTQGPQIIALVSDPLGRGWDLFGTAAQKWRFVPDAGVVWHTQVWLILAGHIVSVYLAHVEALRLFGTTRRAMWSQLPMLLLMVVLTTLGLWILSLPISR